MAENNKVNSVSFFNSRPGAFPARVDFVDGVAWKPVVGLCQGKYIIFYCIERQSERS